MLVLSRKQNQQIVVGGDVTITVLRIRGNTVRLGIEAPAECRVRRAELPQTSLPDCPPGPSADFAGQREC
jgi:carbon storage regulator CsrA